MDNPTQTLYGGVKSVYYGSLIFSGSKGTSINCGHLPGWTYCHHVWLRITVHNGVSLTSLTEIRWARDWFGLDRVHFMKEYGPLYGWHIQGAYEGFITIACPRRMDSKWTNGPNSLLISIRLLFRIESRQRVSPGRAIHVDIWLRPWASLPMTRFIRSPIQLTGLVKRSSKESPSNLFPRGKQLHHQFDCMSG